MRRRFSRIWAGSGWHGMKGRCDRANGRRSYADAIGRALEHGAVHDEDGSVRLGGITLARRMEARRISWPPSPTTSSWVSPTSSAAPTTGRTRRFSVGWRTRSAAGFRRCCITGCSSVRTARALEAARPLVGGRAPHEGIPAAAARAYLDELGLPRTTSTWISPVSTASRSTRSRQCRTRSCRCRRGAGQTGARPPGSPHARRGAVDSPTDPRAATRLPRRGGQGDAGAIHRASRTRAGDARRGGIACDRSRAEGSRWRASRRCGSP